jgi:hypothetical protein
LFILDPDPDFLLIPDPGSGSATLLGTGRKGRALTDLFGLVQEGLVLEDEDPARLLQGAQVGVQQSKLAGSLLLHFNSVSTKAPEISGLVESEEA